MDGFLTVEKDGARLVVRDGWECLLDAALWDGAGEAVVAYPDRTVRRLATAQGTVFVKVFRPDGIPSLWKRLRHTLRDALCGQAALRLLNIHAELEAAGLACPQALLAGVRGDEQVFVTREANGLPMSQAMKLDQNAARKALATAARGVRRLHDAGFVHGDCIPGNLLLDGETVCFLDNDRTARISFWSLPRGRRRNLIQFCSRLPEGNPLSAEEAARAFLEAYDVDPMDYLPAIHFRREVLAAQRRRRLAARSK